MKAASYSVITLIIVLCSIRDFHDESSYDSGRFELVLESNASRGGKPERDTQSRNRVDARARARSDNEGRCAISSRVFTMRSRDCTRYLVCSRRHCDRRRGVLTRVNA